MVKIRQPKSDPVRGFVAEDVGEAPYPEPCGRCAARGRQRIHDKCALCQDLAFQEAILCDLNRSVQDWNRFNCYAFRPASMPRLSSVASGQGIPGGQDSPIIPRGDDALLDSDRFKYGQALAVQKARNNPDTVYVDIKYHVAWNVTCRKPVFVRPVDIRHVIDEAFFACGERIGGFASVLWLAPDHVHVYVESDGERSLEAIVKELKRMASSAIPEGLISSGRSRRAWDRAYFAQTIG